MGLVNWLNNNESSSASCANFELIWKHKQKIQDGYFDWLEKLYIVKQVFLFFGIHDIRISFFKFAQNIIYLR